MIITKEIFNKILYKFYKFKQQLMNKYLRQIDFLNNAKNHELANFSHMIDVKRISTAGFEILQEGKDVEKIVIIK
jgi:hypothetical protein